MDNWNEFDDTSWQIAFCIIQLVCYVDILEENSKQDMIYTEKAFFFITSEAVLLNTHKQTFRSEWLYQSFFLFSKLYQFYQSLPESNSFPHTSR